MAKKDKGKDDPTQGIKDAAKRVAALPKGPEAIAFQAFEQHANTCPFGCAREPSTTGRTAGCLQGEQLLQALLTVKGIPKAPLQAAHALFDAHAHECRGGDPCTVEVMQRATGGKDAIHSREARCDVGSQLLQAIGALQKGNSHRG